MQINLVNWGSRIYRGIRKGLYHLFSPSFWVRRRFKKVIKHHSQKPHKLTIAFRPLTFSESAMEMHYIFPEGAKLLKGPFFFCHFQHITAQ